MVNFHTHYEADRPNTITALGLRWSALRGMLGSALIEADEHHELREELLRELQSIRRSMSEIAAKNAIELCAKIDVLSEELRRAAGDEDSPTEALVASIRKDVMGLPRGVAERSTVQIVRGAAPLRTAEPPPSDRSTSAES